MPRIFLYAFLGWCLAFPGVSFAQNKILKFAATDWPWWRGPDRNGIANPNQKPPLHWGEKKNVVWKTPVPGRGHGSPTIVGDRIYLATAEKKNQTQSVVCFDRKTGKLIWKTLVHKGGFDKRGNKRSSQASSTVACDGERLFINFNHKRAIHTTALDLDGKILWQKKITPYVTHQGFGSSPAIYGSLVLVSADNKGGGAITALDRKTGKVVWKHQRPKMPNYASPIVVNVAGKDQLIFTGCKLVSSYEPKTGKKIWEIEGATTETVTSTVTDGRVVITSGGYPRNHIAAVAADGSGKIVWNRRIRCYVPSMVLKDGNLYAVTDPGFAYCLDCKTGEERWSKRLPGTFYSSPVLVGDVFFVTNQTGVTFVYKATPKKFETIAVNKLGDDVFATPTFVGSKIYMRVGVNGESGRQEYLYCLGK